MSFYSPQARPGGRDGPKRVLRLLLSTLRLGIGVALLVYLIVSGAIDWSSLPGLFTSWLIVLTAFVLLLADVVVTAWRLCVLLRPHGLHLTLFASIRLTLIGNFFNICLPGATGGDAVKIYYATLGNRGRRMEVATVLLLDRAVGMFALMLWPLLAAPFFPDLLASSSVFVGLLGAAAGAAAIMALGVVLCSSSIFRYSRLLKWAFRTLPLGSYIERIVDTVYTYRHNPGTLFATVVISLVAHSLAVGVALLVAEAVCPKGAAWEMTVLIPLCLLANALPLTPGGLGVGEAAANKLFALAGMSCGAETLLGWRLLMILTGLLGLVFYLQGQQRFVQARIAGEMATEELSRIQSIPATATVGG